MNRVHALVGVIAILVLPICFICVLSNDLAHPERWDKDWTRDPRIYVPLGGVLVLVPTALLVRELLRPRLAVRLQQLLDRASELRRAGRHAEADRILDEFERLWNRHGLNRRRPLS